MLLSTGQLIDLRLLQFFIIRIVAELLVTYRAVVLLAVQFVDLVCNARPHAAFAATYVRTEDYGTKTCAAAVAGKQHQHEDGGPEQECELLVQCDCQFIRLLSIQEQLIRL